MIPISSSTVTMILVGVSFQRGSLSAGAGWLTGGNLSVVATERVAASTSTVPPVCGAGSRGRAADSRAKPSGAEPRRPRIGWGHAVHVGDHRGADGALRRRSPVAPAARLGVATAGRSKLLRSRALGARPRSQRLLGGGAVAP